ncbi:hypothetical protein IFR05_012009 [Cadophora sp. M221]|nr:hypothetical protein IFR05_012009 [Cadophora sp. M221]
MRLLFVLHIHALSGPSTTENIKIISKGGESAVHLAICSYEVEIGDEEKQLRNPKTIHKYLVDESLPEYIPKDLPEIASEIAEDSPENESALPTGGVSNSGHFNTAQEDEAVSGSPVKEEDADDATHISTPSLSNQSKKRARPTDSLQDRTASGIGPEVLERRFIIFNRYHS